VAHSRMLSGLAMPDCTQPGLPLRANLVVFGTKALARDSDVSYV
jgi:hypothetical protein